MKYNKTFCAQITGILDNGKYETLYKGKKYTVSCNRALTVGTEHGYGCVHRRIIGVIYL